MKKINHPELNKLFTQMVSSLSQNEKDFFESQKFQNFFRDLDVLLLSKDQELNHLRPVIDVIPNTISWIKKDLTYVGVNQALAQMCDLRPEDFVGKFVGFHSNDKMIFEFAYDLFHGSQRSLVKRIESKIADREKIFLLIGSLLENDEAIITGVDVTELEGLKNQVQFNEKLVTLGELFAGIVHDMNNPLTLIEGHIFRIKKLYPNEAALHESLDKVSLSVKKISKLTKSVRIFARNESGKGDFQEKLNTLFEEALAMLEHRLMQFQVDIDPQFKNFLFQGNCTEIFRVFLNLLSNSVDALQEASAEAKWIKISLNEDMTDIYLTFTDGGNGIPESVQKRLFEPFYTTKAVGKGTGMGLSLSRKIARDHDGDLVLDQSCPHTTFVMRIPKSRIQKL